MPILYWFLPFRLFGRYIIPTEGKLFLILLDINDFEHFLFDLFAVC